MGNERSGRGARPPAPPDELDRRALRGIKSLLIRQVCLQLITVAGSVVLARVLGPKQFGLFVTVNVSVVIIGYFGNFGIAPSFIQRRDELTEKDLQVGFTLQLLLTSLVVAGLVIGAPTISRLYGSTYPDLTWLIRALAFSLYLTTWRSMSALQLERTLRYRALAWIEVLEATVFQTVAIALAVAGIGAMSLVAAVLARGVVGTALVYAAAPWKIRIGFDAGRAREILAFGIPFQIQGVINAGGVAAPPVVTGMILGPIAAGYLNWAQNIGSKPITAVESVMRVGFAHFSRLQEQVEQVEEKATRYLTVLLLMSGLWFALIASTGHDLVPIVFGEKWVPAVGALVLYAAALNFSVMSSVGAVTMNSVGRVRFVTYVMSLRSAITIGFTLLIAYKLGYGWVPVAWVVGGALEALGVYYGLGTGAVRRLIVPVLWVVCPIAAGAVAGIIVARSAVTADLRVVLTASAVAVVYALVGVVASPAWLRRALRERAERLFRPVRAAAAHGSVAGDRAL